MRKSIPVTHTSLSPSMDKSNHVFGSTHTSDLTDISWLPGRFNRTHERSSEKAHILPLYVHLLCIRRLWASWKGWGNKKLFSQVTSSINFSLSHKINARCRDDKIEFSSKRDDKNEFSAVQYAANIYCIRQHCAIERRNNRWHKRQQRNLPWTRSDFDAPRLSADVKKCFQETSYNLQCWSRNSGDDFRFNKVDSKVEDKKQLWSASTMLSRTRKRRGSVGAPLQEEKTICKCDGEPQIDSDHQTPSPQQCMYLSRRGAAKSAGCQFVAKIPLTPTVNDEMAGL